MQDVTTRNFGLLIAYILPGLTLLWGISEYSETVRQWFGGHAGTAPTVSGFLYVTLASIAAGLVVGTVRWLVVDRLHHATGIGRPQWDVSELDGRVGAFYVLVEHHFRHYQFHGGMLVSLALTYVARRWSADVPTPVGMTDAAYALLAVLFFAASRDTLANYNQRTSELLKSR